MSEPSANHPLSSEEVPGRYHRALTKEWSNYDSVEGEMRSIYYNYVEALRFSPGGGVVGMAKIGTYSTDPKANGAAELDPDRPESFNFIGHWELRDGVLWAELGPGSDKVTLVAKWVGIFFLPGRITLAAGTIAANELRAQVSYDRHPNFGEEAVPAVYQRLDPLTPEPGPGAGSRKEST